MSLRRVFGLFLTVFLVSVSQARAARIDVSAVSTDMGSGFGTLLQNTVNGVGLDALTLTALHDPTRPYNSWVSSAALTGQVTFDLGGLYSVNGFSFWNQNDGGPGIRGTTGIQDVNVLFSTDGLNFNRVVGAPTSFSRVRGIGPLGPEMFTFAPILATQIRFQIQSNYGDIFQTGFAEVGFDGTGQIPEPASLALLGSGMLIGLARYRRRPLRSSLTLLRLLRRTRPTQ
jgi:hypothetical protein